METLLMVVHYFLCFFLILVILLQAGRGANIGATFGGASQTLFGSRGPATFLNKITTGVAILFLTTSIWMAQIAKEKSNPGSVLDNAKLPTQTETLVPSPAEAVEGQAAPEEKTEEKRENGK